MLSSMYPPKKHFTHKTCSSAHGGCGKPRLMPAKDDICGQCLFAWSLPRKKPPAPLRNLRRIRRAKDITQAELARRSGVSLRAIASHELGESRRTYKDIGKRLARALGVSVNELTEEK